jgi:hypothetical protein
MEERMDDSDFEFWANIAEILQKGDLTSPDKYPDVWEELYFACKIFWETYDYALLQAIVNNNPWVIDEAKRNKAEREAAEEECPFRPFPEGEELELIQGQFNLGYVNPQGDMAGLDPLDFARGLFICGEIGAGKTYPALRIYDQILSIPIEERGFNLLIIQLVKRDADFLIKRHPNLRIVDWKHFRRNIFQVEPWDEPWNKIKSACAVFASINYLLSLTQPILKHAVIRRFHKNGVFSGSNNFPSLTEILHGIDGAARDLNLEGWESRNIRDKLKVRLTDFIEAGEMLACKYGYPIDTFWSREDICLNVMDEASPYIAGTAVMDLLVDLQRYYERTPQHPARLRTLIGLDECRSIFPVQKDDSEFQENRYMEKFVTTARSCGIGRITITQEPQSVSSWLTNNSAFFMTFPIAGEAVDHLKKLQNLTDEQIKYIDELPEYGAGIFRDRRFNRPYLVGVSGDLEIEAISEEEVEEFTKSYIEQLQAQLPEPVEEHSEPEPLEVATLKKQALIQLDAMCLIETLKKHPFAHYTKLLEKLQLSTARMSAAEAWLKNEELVIPVECQRSTRSAKHYALTERAQDSLDIPLSQRIAPSRYRHTLYCEQVKTWAQARGYKAVREFNGNGRYRERIDVYTEQDGRKVAYEIQLTLNADDLMVNIRKCISLFKVHELCIVCEDSKDMGQAKQIVSDRVSLGRNDGIYFKTVNYFFQRSNST